jgi:hypothetical protein
MKIKFIISALVLVLLVVSTSFAQGFYHKYIMRGTVLHSTDGKIYLCVGTSDGAKAGQVLTVVRFKKEEGEPHEPPSFNREVVWTAPRRLDNSG